MKIKLSILILLCIFAVSLSAQIARADSIEWVGACSTPGITWGVFVQDSFAYVADRGDFAIVNIVDQSSPFVVSSLNTPFTWALGVFVKDTLAYLHTSNKFTIVNVANPSSPNVLGWCYIDYYNGLDPKGISVVDSIAYVPRGNTGLKIVNIAKIDSPFVIATYDTPGNARDIYVRDTVAFIADYDSLQIINVAIPSNPDRIGAKRMPNACHDVFVSGFYAYVVCQSNYGTDGSLQIVDISNLSLPNIVESVDNINGDPFAIYILSNYAYIAAADYWDYRLISKGEERIVGGLKPLYLLNHRADVEGGLRIVNISNPLNPYLVCSYDTPGDPRDVFVVNNLVYMADYDSLQILRHLFTGVSEKIDFPLHSYNIELLRNSPNPFEERTVIQFQIPFATAVSLEIYNVSGRVIKTLINDYKERGTYKVYWDRQNDCGEKVPAGVYFCKLKFLVKILNKKMVVIH